MIQGNHGRGRIGHRRLSAFVIARAPGLRVFFVLLGLLALTVQTLVVQTHIHIAQRTAILSSVGDVSGAGTLGWTAVGKTSAPRDRYPANEDPSNCPLCQEFAHFGHFTQGTVFFVAALLSSTIRHSVYNDAPIPFTVVTHLWRGRAPPSQTINSVAP
jgi:hypothetical protein